jgi:cysteine desulfurase
MTTAKIKGASSVTFDADIAAQAMTLSSQPIYLDNHATTPVDPRVAAVISAHVAHTYGNASSVDHTFGDAAEIVIAETRRDVANLLDAWPEDVLFTSGATESVNLALQGFAARFSREHGRRPRVAVTAVEHRAVLETARALAGMNRIDLVELPVDGEAQLRLDALYRAVEDRLDLIAVMAANNEVGTVYPIAEVGAVAASAGAVFFCDATQAVGRLPISMATSRITMLACSGHKLYGPKGVGALVLSPEARLDPINFGGGHQRGLRPGTLDVPNIAGFGAACRLRQQEMDVDERRIASLRNHLEGALLATVSGLVVNGQRDARLAANLHVSVEDVPNVAIISRVRDRVALATGSACSSGLESASHVLQAMGMPLSRQEGALRFGLGKFTTIEEIDEAAGIVAQAVEDARRALH